jgi:N-formylglutamate amidohydrolase
MFDAPLAVTADSAGPRVQAGLGVIPRIVRDGAEIYRGRWRPAEAEERLSRALSSLSRRPVALIEETRAQFGFAVLVDCHSMPSAAAAPDIVLGDRYGLSAAGFLMRAAERMFERHGFSVARNSPYAGGYTTHLYGRPARGVHALQVEINRGLYLDEERVARGAGFAEVQMRIARVLADLIAMDVSQLRPGGGTLGTRRNKKRPPPKERPSSGRKRPGRATASRRGYPRCRIAIIWHHLRCVATENAIRIYKIPRKH